MDFKKYSLRHILGGKCIFNRFDGEDDVKKHQTIETHQNKTSARPSVAKSKTSPLFWNLYIHCALYLKETPQDYRHLYAGMEYVLKIRRMTSSQFIIFHRFWYNNKKIHSMTTSQREFNWKTLHPCIYACLAAVLSLDTTSHSETECNVTNSYWVQCALELELWMSWRRARDPTDYRLAYLQVPTRWILAAWRNQLAAIHQNDR